MTSGIHVNYLRVSVTDRCNLRCIYCNPLDDGRLVTDREILSFDEIHRVVRLCAKCGVTRVRLTGGEPLVRENIVDLIRRLSGISEIEDLSLTTNGVRLAQMAAELKDAGLTRVNVSLDAADTACYRLMTGADVLSGVMSGIDKAIEVGLTPVSINCVVLRGINLAQVPSLAEMSLHRRLSVRFIEYYRTGDRASPTDWYVPNGEVRRLIESRVGSLVPVAVADAGGPAVYFRAAGTVGTIGFISGRSSAFCARCSRLRLTSDGKFRPCLHSTQSYDISRPLRDGAGDDVLLGLIGEVLQAKGRYTESGPVAREFSMQRIGG
jgi:cyclic pyranopterin phosphate synthase